jgi:hypothetical protein
VPVILHPSQEIQQVVGETQAKRELSQPEIIGLASTLNWTLSEHKHRKELRSKPTFQQLCAQADALRKAVKKLKLALPSAEQSSLRNYLIHLGEEYAGHRRLHNAANTPAHVTHTASIFRSKQAPVFPINSSDLPNTVLTQRCQRCINVALSSARTGSRTCEDEDIVYWTTPACHSGNPTSF